MEKAVRVLLLALGVLASLDAVAQSDAPFSDTAGRYSRLSPEERERMREERHRMREERQQRRESMQQMSFEERQQLRRDIRDSNEFRRPRHMQRHRD